MWTLGRGGRSCYLLEDRNLFVVRMSNYQMPRPMSTMPIASHPTTPTEIMVSSVILESDWFGLGLESESADFITESKSVITEQMDAEISARFMPSGFLKEQDVLSFKSRGGA